MKTKAFSLMCGGKEEKYDRESARQTPKRTAFIMRLESIEVQLFWTFNRFDEMTFNGYSSDGNSFFFQKSLYYTFFYGIISFVLVLVGLLLLYVTCSKRYRLNWFEKNLLERADFELARSENEVVSVVTENESNRSVSSLSAEKKFWVPLRLSKSSSSINESSLGESTAACFGSRNSIVSIIAEDAIDGKGNPLIRTDKQVVLSTGKLARPRVSSMNTKLDHTKIDSTFYQEVSKNPSIDIKRGSINVSISYDQAAGILTVRLIQAKDLLPRDFSGTSDPYAKIHLLPDQKNVWQTRIHKKTLNPVFDEDFVFEVPSLSLHHRTLEIILYDFDAYSRHLSLGEVILPLSEYELSEKITLWKALEPCSEPHKKKRMGKKDDKLKMGWRFGRPDIERCDLFYDLGFLDWDKYLGKPVELNEACKKGVQMLSSVPDGGKKKCGITSMSGYFDPDLRSIYVKDRYLEKWKIGGRPTPHPLKGPWVPCHPASKHSTPGDNYGTFTKASEYTAFSPLTREVKKKQEKLRNFITNPGKKGNCGYPNIGINKYPPHILNDKVDSYFAADLLHSQNWKKHKEGILFGPLKAGFYPRNFDENPYKDSSLESTYVQRKEKEYGKSRGIFIPSGSAKFSGYSETGCFNKFPEWTPEPYITANEAMKKLGKTTRSNLVFRPEPQLKSYYTVSVVNKKADLACNERTWRTMVPITYPQFNL